MRSTCSAVSHTYVIMFVATAVLAATPALAQRQGGGQQQQQQQSSAKQPVQSASADLEDVARHPDKYIGKMITVEGEAVAVLGPHLFVVDEPKWFHLWGGMLVLVPEPFATIVRSDAPVRVTGTVEKATLAEAKRKWSFLSNDPRIEVDLFEKPVLVASEVTTVAPSLVSLKFEPGQQPTGTSGGGNGTPVTDLKQLRNDTSIVGRAVAASGTVSRMEGQGFWIQDASGDEVFVMPTNKVTVRQGQSVDVQGRVLESPRDAQGSKNSKGDRQRIYIYADKVTPK
jgi:uncharacterized protein YdeI (BOF family)